MRPYAGNYETHKAEGGDLRRFRFMSLELSLECARSWFYGIIVAFMVEKRED